MNRKINIEEQSSQLPFQVHQKLLSYFTGFRKNESSCFFASMLQDTVNSSNLF